VIILIAAKKSRRARDVESGERSRSPSTFRPSYHRQRWIENPAQHRNGLTPLPPRQQYRTDSPWNYRARHRAKRQVGSSAERHVGATDLQRHEVVAETAEEGSEHTKNNIRIPDR